MSIYIYWALYHAVPYIMTTGWCTFGRAGKKEKRKKRLEVSSIVKTNV